MVFMFQASSNTLKFAGNSMTKTSTFEAPFQVVVPEGEIPVKPKPVRILAP